MEKSSRICGKSAAKAVTGSGHYGLYQLWYYVDRKYLGKIVCLGLNIGLLFIVRYNQLRRESQNNLQQSNTYI